jgi:hypothetical protein
MEAGVWLGIVFCLLRQIVDKKREAGDRPEFSLL